MPEQFAVFDKATGRPIDGNLDGFAVRDGNVRTIVFNRVDESGYITDWQFFTDKTSKIVTCAYASYGVDVPDNSTKPIDRITKELAYGPHQWRLVEDKEWQPIWKAASP